MSQGTIDFETRRAIAPVARLLACYDMRMQVKDIAKTLGYSVNYASSLLTRIRRLGAVRLWAQHIRDIRVLGLNTLIVHAAPLPDSVVDSLSLRRLEQALPYARYLLSYRVTGEGIAAYSFIIPIELSEEMTRDILAALKPSFYDYGFVAPVNPYCGDLPAREVLDNIDVFEEKLTEPVERQPPIIEYGILELLIYAMLDINPLASLRELQDPRPVLVERLEKDEITPVRLKYNKVKKSYERLSSQGYVGRVLLHRVLWGDTDIVGLYVLAKRECAHRLYAAASATLSAASVFVGEKTAASVVAMPDSLLPSFRRALGGCLERAMVIAEGFGTTLPVEMYHPRRGWSLEPIVDLDRLLANMPVAKRGSEKAGG